MKLRYLLTGVALAASLTGCATTSGPQAQQTVYAVEGSLTAAMQVATLYAQLPTCGHGVQPCSDPATVGRIQAAAAAAVQLVNQAQVLVTSPNATQAQITAAVSAAEQAVLTLTSLANQQKVH